MKTSVMIASNPSGLRLMLRLFNDALSTEKLHSFPGTLATNQYRILPFLILSKYVKVKINRTTVVPFVLYVCVTWSLTLREEHRLSYTALKLPTCNITHSRYVRPETCKISR